MIPDVEVNAIYKHWKGNYYIVLMIGIDEETQEEVVIYRQFGKATDATDPRSAPVWVRPKDRWFDQVSASATRFERVYNVAEALGR